MTNYNKKWILLLILSIIWGSSFILIKKSLVGLTPLQVGSLRIIFTAIVISIYSYSSLKEIPKKSWKWIFLTAYVGIFPCIFGEFRTDRNWKWFSVNHHNFDTNQHLDNWNYFFQSNFYNKAGGGFGCCFFWWDPSIIQRWGVSWL